MSLLIMALIQALISRQSENGEADSRFVADNINIYICRDNERITFPRVSAVSRKALYY